MKNLLLMRHAKSSWDIPGTKDHDRPLNDRGRGSAPLIGALLQSEDLIPDFILISDSKRTSETAELLTEHIHYSGPLKATQNLYGSSAEDYLDEIREVDSSIQTMLIIGHNPTIENLVRLYSKQIQPMPTAALAYFKLDLKNWKDISIES